MRKSKERKGRQRYISLLRFYFSLHLVYILSAKIPSPCFSSKQKDRDFALSDDEDFPKAVEIGEEMREKRPNINTTREKSGLNEG